MLAPACDSTTLGWLRVVALQLDQQYAAEGGGPTHGWMAYTLAMGLGLPEAVARGSGQVLDALQPATDLADNLADEELDRALGRDPDARYPGVPRDVLPALPALTVGAVISELHARFPEPEYASIASSRMLIRALGGVVRGQALPTSDPRRVPLLSGELGRLWCLPLWLLPRALPRGRATRVERWAVAWATTVQLHWDVVESAGPAHGVALERLRTARQAAVAVWPRFAPFRPGDVFGPAIAHSEPTNRT